MQKIKKEFRNSSDLQQQNLFTEPTMEPIANFREPS